MKNMLSDFSLQSTEKILVNFRKLFNVIHSFLSSPRLIEVLRYIILGATIEASKIISSKLYSYSKQFFVIKASFQYGDYAFDWIKSYLDHLQIWNQSRVFRVNACSPYRLGGWYPHCHDSNTEYVSSDGIPKPVYQPAPDEPTFFHWKGYWISVDMSIDVSSPSKSTQASSEIDGLVKVLTLSVWSRNRRVLDDFVQEARSYYCGSLIPPRKLSELPERSGSAITVTFFEGDVSYDWILAFMRTHSTSNSFTDLQVTTKPFDISSNASSWSLGRHCYPEKRHFMFKPSPKASTIINWEGNWVQFDVDPNRYDYESKLACSTITLTIHNSSHLILHNLVDSARTQYRQQSTSKVIIHMASSGGFWRSSICKSRRSFESLILPDGVKEKLLDDAHEFLASELWYNRVGIPYRRGYLLYGMPGTGKSTTVHALAGELGLEIYCIQLASPGMDDTSLGRLISETPSKCIILLEDIDCAFPTGSRGGTPGLFCDSDDESLNSFFGKKRVVEEIDRKRSEITLSGLLNVLDSVSSEEGRITFATTNHIEKLDPALTRPGRMDVKLEYKPASRLQIKKLFLHFFENDWSSLHRQSHIESRERGNPSRSDEDITILADHFSNAIPEDTFSLAQVQGYLLMSKDSPLRAINGVPEWLNGEYAKMGSDNIV